MQIFVLLFIEGGSYIEEEDEKWEFVTLYQDGNFVGYCSLYPFYYFPDQVRLRTAQFLVLPPYQQGGVGSRLYESIFEWAIKRPDVAELTVEDPSEAFQELRDKCDLRRAIREKALDGIAPPIDADWAAKTQRRLKLADRQFSRVLEMSVLRSIQAKKVIDDKEMRAFRLLVKERLYRINKDVLMQLDDRGERRAKLADAYRGVVDEYESLLEAIAI